jgi:Putative prokaryotic signal transducing protein
MSKAESDDIVRLVTATNPAQAHIWEQALRDAGIQCRVVGDYLDAGVGDIPGVRAELWVHRDDVARAEAVLKEVEAPSADEED